MFLTLRDMCPTRTVAHLANNSNPMASSIRMRNSITATGRPRLAMDPHPTRIRHPQRPIHQPPILTPPRRHRMRLLQRQGPIRLLQHLMHQARPRRHLRSQTMHRPRPGTMINQETGTARVKMPVLHGITVAVIAAFERRRAGLWKAHQCNTTLCMRRRTCRIILRETPAAHPPRPRIFTARLIRTTIPQPSSSLA